ncbi:MAG: acetyl-CoA carboxylase carboxyltransferase subunit beta [Bacteroidia bacterium]
MSWFKRVKEGILTKTQDKKPTPDGLWYKCPKCKNPTSTKEFEQNLWICPSCNHHGKIGSTEYFEILFDEGRFKELDANLISGDPLKFEDTKAYTTRLQTSSEKSGLKDAVRTATGRIHGLKVSMAVMDFGFIGGSMGSVVGEKIARAIDVAIENNLPMIIISKSGGARMMEAAFSLMQMAKTSAKLALLAKKGLPYISILTDPTTGGVTASFAMLGDINIAEPNALIGFAGPRVIKETIGKDLPEGFQRSEFLLEHGFVDMIVDRKELKHQLHDILHIIGTHKKHAAAPVKEKKITTTQKASN